jgi:uncharacterized membrane protein YgcG
MPRSRHLQTNFTAGEFSPRLFGRVDLERYPNGARELMNVVIHPQGGAQRRTGSYFCGAVKTESSRVRLVSFIPTRAAGYVLEFGDLYVRFWRNRGAVMAGTAALELVTPYPLAVLRELRFTQSVDVMYIFHESYETRKLSRTATDTFNLTTAVFRDGPYTSENTGNPTVATGSGTTTSGGTVTPPTTGGTDDAGAGGTGGDSGGDSGGSSGDGDGGGDGGGGGE